MASGLEVAFELGLLEDGCKVLRNREREAEEEEFVKEGVV